MSREKKPNWPKIGVLVGGALTIAVFALKDTYPQAGCSVLVSLLIAAVAAQLIARARTRRALESWAA